MICYLFTSFVLAALPIDVPQIEYSEEDNLQELAMDEVLFDDAFFSDVDLDLLELDIDD